MRKRRTRSEWRKQERYVRRCKWRQQNSEKVKFLRKILFFCCAVFAVVVLGVYSWFGGYDKQTQQVVANSEVKPPVKPDKSAVKKTKVEIKTKKTKVLLSEHTIYNPNSSADRNWNMKLAAKIINGPDGKGYLLLPGENFSYLETVGNTTVEKGFRETTVIVRGKAVPGIGGGVCQVMSDVNTAIIEAGLETKAIQHSKGSNGESLVSYIHEERGDREATVSYDSGIDFSFQNTLEDPIRFKIIVKGGDVTTKVWAIKYQKN